MTADHIIRAAVPSAVLAAALGIPADLYHFTIDSRAEEAGTTLFKAHGALLVLSMGLLVVALAGLALKVERLSATGVVCAFAGTLLVLANIATEAFAMPAAPEPLSDPQGYWLAVIILSFGLFSFGWLLVSVSAMRAGALGRAAGLLLCFGALVAFTPLQGAYILLLAGVAVATPLAIWKDRTHDQRSPSRRISSVRRRPLGS
jgi:hypothetical protein